MQNEYQHWEQFLRRPAISVDREQIRNTLSSKRVLITGAGGCIGSALAKECAEIPMESLILLDSSEKGIYDLDCDLREAGCNVSGACIVGDICDEAMLDETFAMYRPNIVFHAAACKHVTLMEKNPFTAARTNIIGTHRIAVAANHHAAEQLILLSTDKAVDPASIMGATKRIAELIVLANSGGTQMKAVRLGNVLGSSGSVVPLFLKQIAAGGPVTVTHPDATRYFVTLDEAVSLLLSAVLDKYSAAVLIPDPGKARRIEELAEFLILQAGTPDIRMVYTELRPGDKLHECLLSDEESMTVSAGGPLRAVHRSALPEQRLHRVLSEITQAIAERDLGMLMQAICNAVPEYRPGALLMAEAKLGGRETR